MLTLLKLILSRSVFSPILPNTAMNDVLAILFHRLAATVYMLYGLWATITIVSGIPPITQAEGDMYQIIFSTLVLITTIPACVGATFWPVLARLELFAGSGFLGLTLLYLYFILQSVILGEATWSGFTLIWSIVILPASRTIVVIVLLLRQAHEREALV